MASGGTAGKVRAALAALAASDDPAGQGEACGTLRALAANSAGKVALMQAKAAEPLTQFILDAGAKAKGADAAGVSAAAACLAGLSSVHSGKHLIGAAAALVPALSALLQDGSKAGRAEAAAALGALLAINPALEKPLLDLHAPQHLAKMLEGESMEGREAAMALLVSLTARPSGQAPLASDPLLLEQVVKMLEVGSQRAQAAAATVLRQCATNETHRGAILRGGAADLLQRLLQYTNDNAVKEACEGALSALWASTYQQQTTELAAETAVEAKAEAVAETAAMAATPSTPFASAAVDAPVPASVAPKAVPPQPSAEGGMGNWLAAATTTAAPAAAPLAPAAAIPFDVTAPLGDDDSLDLGSLNLGSDFAVPPAAVPQAASVVPTTTPAAALAGFSSTRGLGALTGGGGFGSAASRQRVAPGASALDSLDASLNTLNKFVPPGEAEEEAAWRAEQVHVGNSTAGAAPLPTAAAPVTEAAPGHNNDDAFGYNARQLQDFARGAGALPVEEFTWGGAAGPGASEAALADLDDVMPLVELLQTGDDSAKAQALAALKNLALDHQQALMEANVVGPLVTLLDRAGKLAAVQGLEAHGTGVAEAAFILNALWRWGRPHERAHLEKSTLPTLDGLVQLLYSGTGKGKEAAASALSILGSMSDGIKIAMAEAGAVKPLVKLLHSGTASGKEEAEAVLWTLLALNRDQSSAVRMSMEAAADMVLLLGTTEQLAKEAAGVLRHLIPHNRSTLVQAGAVEGLMQVLHSAGQRCTGDGVGVSEAATALEVLARGDTRISAICLEAIPGIIALLMRGTQTGREQSVGALWALSAVNDRCKVSMVEEGAVSLLVDLLGKGANRQMDETTAGVLYSLLAINSRSRKFWSRYSDGRTDQEVALTLAAAKGLVPLLHTGSELMREAAAGVVNLCATTDRNRVNVLRARAVEPLVELLSSGSEGAREQAGAALAALVDLVDPNDPQAAAGPARAAVDAVEALVAAQRDYATADKSLAALLEQVVYDAFDRHVEAHTYVFEALEQEWQLQGTHLIPELRSLRERGLNNWRGGQPLVELLTFANGDTQARATLGLAALSVPTLMELVEAGCLRQLVDLVGAMMAEPLIALMLKGCEHPEGQGLSAYAQAVAYLAARDTRVSRMAEDAVMPLVPVLEVGAPKAKEEAVTAVRHLMTCGEAIKVLVAKVGLFGPLVELLGTGTPKTKEMAAFCLEGLTALMAECNVEVNVSRAAALDLVKIVENGTESAAEGAVGVLHNVCNSDGNKSVVMHNKCVEPIIQLLVEGSPPARSKAASCLSRLTVYGADAERFMQFESAALQQKNMLAATEANTPGFMGGWLGMTAAPTPAPVVPGGFEGSMAGGPQQQAQRLISVLVNRDTAQEKPGQGGSAEHLAALLQRLLYDIFETSTAFDLNKPHTLPSAPEAYPALGAAPPAGEPPPLAAAASRSAGPIFGDAEDSGENGGAAVWEYAPTPAMEDAERRVLAEVNGAAPGAVAGGKGKKKAVSRSKVAMDVRPLVQLLHAGTEETKLLALEAVQSLNANTQVALIEAGALRPLVELLGAGAAKALVTFLATAASDPEGDSVSDAARALCALAARDVSVGQAALQCVDGLVALLLSGSDKGREEAAAALWSLSITNSKLKLAVAHAGAIPPMLSLLGAGTAAGKEEAAGVLWTLLSHEDERQASIDVKISLSNALDLVHILTCGTDMGKEAAAGTIRLTALLDLNKGPLLQAMVVEPLVELLYASHEGVRAQCAGALRNLAVFQPNVYKEARPELSKAAGEVKRMVAVQLDPASSSQYGAAVLAQLIYDCNDLALKVALPGAGGAATSAAPATTEAATEVLDDPQADEPTRRGAMQRLETNKRVTVMVELLRIAPADQKRFLGPVLACLGMHTKMALLKGGALYPYVELMGSDAGRPLAQIIVNAAQAGETTDVGLMAGALSSLAAADNALAGVCARCVPGLVNMVEHGEVEAREEAAHALKFFSIVSFNLKVQIAEAGAFGPLVKLLGEGTPRAKEGAAGALWRLVSMMNESNIEVNISTKKAADLVVMLHTSTPEGKEAAAGVIRLVAYNDANKLSVMRARAVEPLVDLLESGAPEVREQAAGALNAVAADKDNRRRIVRAAEQVDRLVALQSQQATAHPQLAALLEYLMYDIYDMRREAVAEVNGEPVADRNLHLEVPAPAPSAAAYLAGAGEDGGSGSGSGMAAGAGDELARLKQRGRVLGGSKEANRGLLPLVQLLQTGTDKLKRMAAPALAACSTGTKVALMEAGATRPLVALLGAAAAKALVTMLTKGMRQADGAGIGGGTSVMELANELVECFMGLTENDPRIAAMAAGVGGIVPQLIQLLETGNPAGQEQAAGALRALSVINKNINVTIAREGAFEPLVKLLGAGTAVAREQAAGTLWRQLEMMRENAIEVNISVPRVVNLVQMLRQGTEAGKEAAAAVLRYCCNSDANRANICRGHAVEVLVQLLLTAGPKARLQVGAALRALGKVDEVGADGGMTPLGPHGHWIVRAANEIAALVDLLEEGSLSQEAAHLFTVGDDPAAPAAEAATAEGMAKILAVGKTQSAGAGAQQAAALLEQMLYDMFALRLAPSAADALDAAAVPGKVLAPEDVYLQCVEEAQSTAVFRLLLQMLHTAPPELKRLLRDGVQWLSINTQVAIVETGALKPLVEMLGAGAAPALTQLLADAGVGREGVGVVDAARALRTLSADNAQVAHMATGAVKGLVRLLEVGVFGGKEEAVRALWSLSVVNAELKYSIGQEGALQPLVEMLFTGKESFRDEVVGLLWSLAMNEANLEPIIDVGAAAGLVRTLHAGSEVAQEAAAGVLRLCAAADNNKSAIIWAKAVEPLTDCLNLWNEGVREQAAGALRNLATWMTTDPEVLEAAQEVERLVEVRMVQARLERMVQLPANSGKQNLSALLERLVLDLFEKVSARKAGAATAAFASSVLSASNAALIYGADNAAAQAAQAGKVIEVSKLPTREDGPEGSAPASAGTGQSRALPYIVQLLQDGTDEVKAQAAGAMKNLGTLTMMEIIEAGALMPLVELVGGAALEAVLQLLKALDPSGDGGNAAEFAVALARIGRARPEDGARCDEAIRPLVQVLELGTARGKQEAATALHTLCLVGDQMKFGIAREGAFEPLVKLLAHGTGKAKEEALGVLWQLVAMMAESNVDVNISPGPAGDIAKLLTSGVETTAVSAAGVLKLCAVAELNQKVILKAGALPLLVEALCSAPVAVREQAGGALINLAITDRGWCQDAWLVAAASEVEQLVQLLKHEAVLTTPGLRDPYAAQRQVQALLATLIADIAEFRCLYHAAQRGEALPLPSTAAPPAPIAADALSDPAAADAPPAAEAAAPARAGAGVETFVMEEDGEEVATRRQLVAALLTAGEAPVLQVTTSALRALGVDSKVALMEAGALKAAVSLMGPAAAAALVELIGRATTTPHGASAGDYASALRNLAAMDPEVAGMALGCVQRLTHLLQIGGPKGREEAAAALWNLCTINETIKTAIVEAGAVPFLIDLVNQGLPLARESAAGCLWSMSVVNVNIKELVTRCGATGSLVELLISGSPTAREEACGALWSLSMREEATAEMVAHGAAKAAVEVLYTGTEMGKESAAGLLGLCALVDANKRAIFEARAVEPLAALLGSSADGTRLQAAQALKQMVTFRSAVPRAVDRGVAEVEDLVAKIMPSSGKQLVAAVYSGAQAPASAEQNPLVPVLEQLVYDLFDMATAAAVASARELGEMVPDAVGTPVGRDRSARPLVDLLLMNPGGARAEAAGGLMCLSVNTKMAIIEGGALHELADLLGSGAAKALVQLLAGAGRGRADGGGVMELVAALCALARSDSRVAAVAVGAVPGLVELLQVGNGAGKEQAAGALYYLRHINPNVEALIQQARVVEQLVQVLGMGTAAGRETSATMCALWALLTLEDGAFEALSEAGAANLVQLLYTGTDVGKEGAARVIRMLGGEEGNRAAVMRARAVEPLVELLQMGNTPKLRDEAAAALTALSSQAGTTVRQALAAWPAGAPTSNLATAGWFGTMFGADSSAGQSGATLPVGGSSGAAHGDDEAVCTAVAEVQELIAALRQIQQHVGMEAPVMGGGALQRQRKAAARLEQLMYYLFHAKTSYIVM